MASVPIPFSMDSPSPMRILNSAFRWNALICPYICTTSLVCSHLCRRGSGGRVAAERWVAGLAATHNWRRESTKMSIQSGTVSPLTWPLASPTDGVATSLPPGMAYRLLSAHKKRATPLVDMALPLLVNITVTALQPHIQRNSMQSGKHAIPRSH